MKEKENTVPKDIKKVFKIFKGKSVSYIKKVLEYVKQNIDNQSVVN